MKSIMGVWSLVPNAFVALPVAIALMIGILFVMRHFMGSGKE